MCLDQPRSLISGEIIVTNNMTDNLYKMRNRNLVVVQELIKSKLFKKLYVLIIKKKN